MCHIQNIKSEKKKTTTKKEVHCPAQGTGTGLSCPRLLYVGGSGLGLRFAPGGGRGRWPGGVRAGAAAGVGVT